MAIAPGTQGAVDIATELVEDIEVLDENNLVNEKAISKYMSDKGYTERDTEAIIDTINLASTGVLDENLRRVDPMQELLEKAREPGFSTPEKSYEDQSFLERIAEQYLRGQISETAAMGRGSQLAVAAAIEGAADVASIVPRGAKAIVEPVYPTVVKDIESGLDEVRDFVDSKIQSTETGKKISYALKEIADPAVSPEEAVAVDIVSSLVPFAAASKVTKLAGLKPGVKKRVADLMLFDFAIKGDNDYQFTGFISDTFPSTKPLLDNLAINPDDSASEKELKRVIDSAITAGTFESIFGILGYAGTKTLDAAQRLKVVNDVVRRAKDGVKEQVKRGEAIAVDKIDEPIVNTATAKEVAEGAPVVVKTEAVDLGEQYAQKGIIARVIEKVDKNYLGNSMAKVNTMLARGLKTTGQLPEKLVPAYRRRQNQYQGDLKQIDVTKKILDQDLKRAKKEAKASGQNPDDITTATRAALSGGRDDLQKFEFKINNAAKEVEKKQAAEIIKQGNKNKKNAKNKEERAAVAQQTKEAVQKNSENLKRDVGLAFRGDADAALRLPPELQKLLNQAQSVVGLSDTALARLPAYLRNTIIETKRALNKGDSTVREIYGLKDTDDIILALADDGTTYMTRSYEIYTNPKWSEALRAGIAARSAKLKGVKLDKKRQKISDKNTPEINQIIDDAFKNLKNKNPDVDEQILWKTLDDFADIGAAPEQRGLIFEALSGKRYTTGDTAIKVMAKKNLGIDEPVLAFLGEIKDPVRMVDTTLRNQSKAIALGKFGREVDSYIVSNQGREVLLGGLFESLPKAATRFLPESEVIAATPAALRTPVGEKLSSSAGSIGLSAERLLPQASKFVTSKQMAEVLERGTEMFGYDKMLGGLLGRSIAGTQRLAAFGQATQTTLDLQQHANNLYGMVQALASGGFLKNPAKFTQFAKQTRLEFINSTKQERKLRAEVNKVGANKDVVDAALMGNIEAYNSLPKSLQKIVRDSKELRDNVRLRQAGVLDSSVVATPIKNVTLDRWGDPVTMDGWLGAMGKYAKAPLRMAQQLYGFTDDFGKRIAHKLEMEELRKVYPNKSEDEIFQIAANNVLEVLPSYTYAAPLVRELGKYPVGAYPVYTAERVRNNFNILKLALKELREANATGNVALRNKAATRIAALGAVYAGKEAYRTAQEIENGWTEESKRGLKILLPNWQQSSIQVPTEPFYKDKDGHIKTRFIDGSTFDADSYLRGPVARAYALAVDYQEGELTERELDEQKIGILTDFVAQYYAIKGLYGGVQTAVTGVDEYGRNIYTGITPMENIINGLAALGAPLEPGSTQNVGNYVQSIQAEEVLGEGQGKTKSGFPARSNEIRKFLISGIRDNTFDVNMAISQKIKEAIRERANLANNFYQTIRDIPIKDRSSEERAELQKDIAARFYEIQDKAFEQNALLRDLATVVSGITYADKDDKGNDIVRNLDMADVIATLRIDDTISEAASDFAYNIMTGNVNAPIDFSEDQIIRDMINFDEGTVDANILAMLSAITGDYEGRELRKGKYVRIQ